MEPQAKEPYVSLDYTEMETPLYRKIGRQMSLYMTLRKWAAWETGIATGACSFFSYAAGIHRGTALRQMRKLAAVGAIQFLRCRPGRRQAKSDWTQLRIFDLYGNPLFSKVRNRTINDAPAHNYRCAGATNTPLPSHHKENIHDTGMDGGRDGEEEEELSQRRSDPWRVEYQTSTALLRGLGVKGKAIQDLSERVGLSAMKAAQRAVAMRLAKGNVKEPTGLFMHLVNAKWQERTSAMGQSRHGQGTAQDSQRTGGRQADREGGGGGGGGSKRPGGASAAAKSDPEAEYQQILASRAAYARRHGGPAPIADVVRKGEKS